MESIPPPNVKFKIFKLNKCETKYFVNVICSLNGTK